MKAKQLFILIILTLFASSCFSDIFDYTDMNGKRLGSVECLTVNLYHEARGESNASNLMILGVVFNRIVDNRFPPTSYCGVVFQKKQFSWLSDGKSDKIVDRIRYKELQTLVEYALMHKELVMQMSEGVTHYHSKKVQPLWRFDRGMKAVATLDNHIFYKWGK